ncbi:MAG: YaaA family protein [Candidatus Microsaccharimonas sp.]
MALILLHSSKTMRTAPNAPQVQNDRLPAFFAEATVLASYLQSIMPNDYEIVMKFSHEMAQKTYRLMQEWNPDGPTVPAIDCFLGDIYSGLQAQSFTAEDRQYAHEHLRILSGLYGMLRALDEIQPYRLEMGYKLPGTVHGTSLPNISSLYNFWGDKIAREVAKDVRRSASTGHPPFIINLSAKEYTKVLFPHVKNIEELKSVAVISPKFLTVNPKTGKPTFVAVHAKIARGAFAHWLIKHRIEDIERLKEFDEIGYVYDPGLSTPEEPAFVAQAFQGLGLSVRLAKK